jgi:Uma2 family endonuclease
MTEEEYLEIERRAEFKSEFHDGEMFAMSGGSRPHCAIACNLSRLIGNQLEGSPCVVYSSDLRVKIQADGRYVYPDISVACGEIQVDDEHNDILLNPTVIVEVLSDSSARYDRGQKFEFYRRLPSLREYLLVSQHRPHIEQFIRQDSGDWLLHDAAGLESSLSLPSLSITIPLSKVYSNVRFAPAPRHPGEPSGQSAK